MISLGNDLIIVDDHTTNKGVWTDGATAQPCQVNATAHVYVMSFLHSRLKLVLFSKHHLAMSTLRVVKREQVEILTEQYGEREASSIVDLIIESVCSWDKTEALLQSATKIPSEQVAQLRSHVSRVAAGEPVQYVLGKAHFFGREFKVDSSVLIPRSETEELVQWIIDSLGANDRSLLDIGTGSACIAVTLKLERSDLDVHAIDVSEDALQTAEENCESLNAGVNLHFIDVLDKEDMDSLKGPWDIIVSNPPYILSSEKFKLPVNVREHEPHLALFCDDDPLTFYRAIARYAKEKLAETGQMFFEVHEDHATEVEKMFRELGYSNIEVKIDIHEKNRMLRVSH